MAVERGLIIDIDSYDWNCPQHITRRYGEDEIDRLVKPLQGHIAELEAALARVSRGRLDRRYARIASA
jgi:uncharacterized protein